MLHLCVLDTIREADTEDLNEVTLFVRAVKKLVTHFRRAELQPVLKSMSGITLKLSEPTRWISILEMLQSVEASYEKIRSILVEKKKESLMAGITSDVLGEVS